MLRSRANIGVDQQEYTQITGLISYNIPYVKPLKQLCLGPCSSFLFHLSDMTDLPGRVDLSTYQNLGR